MKKLFIKKIFLTPIKFLFPSNIYSKESKWGKNHYEKNTIKRHYGNYDGMQPVSDRNRKAAYASENTDAVKTTETEKPPLVQGDVFYFVKTMVEDIKMALATNDLEKAKLLSEQAAEDLEKVETEKTTGEEEKRSSESKSAHRKQHRSISKSARSSGKSESKSCNYQKYREEFFKDCS